MDDEKVIYSGVEFLVTIGWVFILIGIIGGIGILTQGDWILAVSTGLMSVAIGSLFIALDKIALTLKKIQLGIKDDE